MPAEGSFGGSGTDGSGETDGSEGTDGSGTPGNACGAGVSLCAGAAGSEGPSCRGSCSGALGCVRSADGADPAVSVAGDSASGCAEPMAWGPDGTGEDKPNSCCRRRTPVMTNTRTVRRIRCWTTSLKNARMIDLLGARIS
jgi:hypothetical protein